ncbi:MULTISPECIES: hypothetical protein [Vibrio]|uniref:hypothetical protein n=1 Tax=Vibrio TaxID=662 RepID=UPI000D3A3127|nr:MULTISPECIES: hypothetical protein [Vibrio]PTO69922.1 hypothetical protein CWN81_16640 [Vibrio splendidus]
MNKASSARLFQLIKYAANDEVLTQYLFEYKLIEISFSIGLRNLMESKGISKQHIVKYLSYTTLNGHIGYLKLKDRVQQVQLVFGVVEVSREDASITGFSICLCLDEEEKEFGLLSTHRQVCEIDSPLT